ncbi:MAG: TlpA disulfide reductase family protein [Spirochaetia bacterium]|jgi:thiol-disulfide isomerase/thioredoxin
MKRNLVIFLGAVVLAANVSAETAVQRMQGLGLAVASKPIDPIEFELQSLPGAPVKLSSLKGKVVFLNFWATWCGPCRSEMPSMQRMYESLRADGLEILAVNLMEDAPRVKGFAKELKLTFSILLDSNGRVGAQYNARAIPTTYLVDRRGLIFARAVGARQWDTPEMLDLLRGILKDGIGF